MINWNFGSQPYFNSQPFWGNQSILYSTGLNPLNNISGGFTNNFQSFNNNTSLSSNNSPSIDYWTKSSTITGRPTLTRNFNDLSGGRYTTDYLPTNTVDTSTPTVATPAVNTPSTTTPTAGSIINYNDPAVAISYQTFRGDIPFDISRYQTQQQGGLFGLGSKTSFDATGAEVDWLKMQSPEFQQAYLNGMTPEQRQIFWAKVGTGEIDINRYQNLNQFQNSATRFLNEQTNSKWTRQDTFSAIQGGIQGINSLANLYMGYKQYQLAKKNMEENLKLQRANYRNTARTINAQYRDQMSGRGSTLTSGRAARRLGRAYQNRRLEEEY